MKKLIFTTIALILMVSQSRAARDFDQRVSEARRHMRAACQAVQGAARAEDSELMRLRTTAAQEASAAERLWTELKGEFTAPVPEGYAGDPAWAQRLEDIRINIARMGKEIGAGQWRPAFLSCAHACNLLATMHEANGVTLAIDAMSTLRKKVGLVRGLLAAGQPQKARSLVKEILAARDAVWLAPLPGAPNGEAYRGQLPALSLATDALAEAARDGLEFRGALDRLAALVEHVYELAI